MDVVAIKEALRALEGSLPAAIHSWEVKVGLDAMDYPAVWVWAILRDDDVPFEIDHEIHDIVYEMLLKLMAGDPDPAECFYIFFRTASELKYL